MKKVIIQLLMAICVIFIINCGSVHASSVDIKRSTEKWFFPAKGEISDIFDSRGGEHKGIDIAGKYMSPIYAAADGVVVKSYLSYSYGNVVFIRHDNGFETVYAHLAKRIVSEGDHVQQGETVGLMGNTGESTGTHLHFEIHEGEWTIDKKNAINPFIVYGYGEIGQLVFALQHDPYGITEVSQPVKVESQGKDIIPIYRVEELSIGLNDESSYQTYPTMNVQNTYDMEITYTVKKGDTLFDISKKWNIPIKTLISLNHIKNKDLIFPDQKIVVDSLHMNKWHNGNFPR
ncbi:MULTISPECIES: peptidoglycan DD-metalloendopeptidase family protein [Heyndrickxia]|nr:peptidoglycan DD-metalloendopeptidase family protein [Heyndrickxia shackletonii]